MIAMRRVYRFISDLIADGFLLVDEAWCRLLFLSSPHGWLASPKQRLRLMADRRKTTATDTEKSNGRRLCIMALYAEELSESTRLSIEFWNRLDFEVIAVNSSRMKTVDLQRLGDMAWRVFERPNMGQDIGAYKDAIIWLRSEGHLNGCSALAITNDSIQWIPGRNTESLDSEIRKFLSEPKQEALFSHMSYQASRHYQSFFQLLKPSVFLSKAFLKFWHRYQPISNRRHCILKGEIGLSKKVYCNLANVRVLYSSEDLLKHLNQMAQDAMGVPAEELLAQMPSVYRTQRLGIENPALEVLIQTTRQGGRLLSSQLLCIMDLIESNNPSHVAAFLYATYLGCPFVKKDLSFAGSFHLGQAINLYRDALITSLGASEEDSYLCQSLAEEYKQVLYNKGIPLGYQNAKFAALRKGLRGGFIYMP